MDSFLGKKYKLDSSENFEEFMKTLGVGLLLRKIGNSVYPVIELNKEGSEYVFTSNSTFKNILLRFLPGVPFDKKTPDGREVKSTITIEDCTMVENEVEKEGRVITYSSKFTEAEVTMFCKAGNVESVRHYKAV